MRSSFSGLVCCWVMFLGRPHERKGVVLALLCHRWPSFAERNVAEFSWLFCHHWLPVLVMRLIMER